MGKKIWGGCPHAPPPPALPLISLCTSLFFEFLEYQPMAATIAPSAIFGVCTANWEALAYMLLHIFISPNTLSEAMTDWLLRVILHHPYHPSFFSKSHSETQHTLGVECWKCCHLCFHLHQCHTNCTAAAKQLLNDNYRQLKSIHDLVSWNFHDYSISALRLCRASGQFTFLTFHQRIFLFTQCIHCGSLFDMRERR